MKHFITFFVLGVSFAQNQIISGQHDSRIRGRQDDRHGDRSEQTTPEAARVPKPTAPAQTPVSPKASSPADAAAPRTTP